MPVIVVTRLRLRNPALLDEFFTDAVAAIEQAMKSEGNLGADALADANSAWWSVSAWQERRLMQAYVDSEPHLGIRDWITSAKGDIRRLGPAQPRPAGLADELAAPHRRRKGGRTHAPFSRKPDSCFPPANRAASQRLLKQPVQNSRSGWPRKPGGCGDADRRDCEQRSLPYAPRTGCFHASALLDPVVGTVVGIALRVVNRRIRRARTGTGPGTGTWRTWAGVPPGTAEPPGSRHRDYGRNLGSSARSTWPVRP